MVSLKDAVNAGVANFEPKKWPTYDGKELDRSAFVTASEIGKCMRQIYFSKEAARKDTPPVTNETWGFFARGDNVEEFVVKALRASGVDVQFMFIGDEQVSLHHGAQSGTPDGVLVTASGQVIVFDIKSIDPRKNRRHLPSKDHVWQVTQNMALVEDCLQLIVSHGVLLYVDASNYQDMLEVRVDYDIDLMENLADRAESILAADSAESLPPEGIYEGTCNFCTFKDHCNAAQERAVELKAQQKAQEKVAKNVFG